MPSCCWWAARPSCPRVTWPRGRRWSTTWSVSRASVGAVGDLLPMPAGRLHRSEPAAGGRRPAPGGHRRVRATRGCRQAGQGASGPGERPARLGRVGDAEIDLFEALDRGPARRDHRQITAALGAAPNAALWGPSPAPKAGGRCLDVVRMHRMTTAAPSLRTSLRCLAVLELLRGRPDKARSMLADARQVVAELGLRHGLMETELYAGDHRTDGGRPGGRGTPLPHRAGRTRRPGRRCRRRSSKIRSGPGSVWMRRIATPPSERIAGHNLKTAIGWRAVRAEIPGPGPA